MSNNEWECNVEEGGEGNNESPKTARFDPQKSFLVENDARANKIGSADAEENRNEEKKEEEKKEDDD